jgi:UDP-N-acetylmuramoylalanine--D-glutamate ligase
MEPVASINGISFINDSKATNAEATARALACFDNIYWIAGGRPKAGGIESLEPYVSRVAHAFLIGEAADDFARTLKGRVAVTRSGDLLTAVRDAAAAAAAAVAKTGLRGVVLLSPACASFDQWPDFEARGDAFRHAVNTRARGDANPAPADHGRMAS